MTPDRNVDLQIKGTGNANCMGKYIGFFFFSYYLKKFFFLAAPVARGSSWDRAYEAVCNLCHSCGNVSFLTCQKGMSLIIEIFKKLSD